MRYCLRGTATNLTLSISNKQLHLVTKQKAWLPMHSPFKSRVAERWSVISSGPDLPYPINLQLSSKRKIEKKNKTSQSQAVCLHFQLLNNHKNFKNWLVATKLDIIKSFRNNFAPGAQQNSVPLSFDQLATSAWCPSRVFKFHLSKTELTVSAVWQL